jgi:RNA polymerase sigma-70 factor, ECF subfamily
MPRVASFLRSNGRSGSVAADLRGLLIRHATLFVSDGNGRSPQPAMIRARRRARELHGLADEELMRLVSAKDPEAFALFYDRQGAAAFSLAYRIAGDRSLAEDIIQEAFLSIWKSRSGFDATRGSVRSWVLAIVRNRAVDAMRRRGGDRPMRVAAEEILYDEPAPDDTEGAVLRRAAAAEVRGALGELPPDQSEVLELAYFGGFSQSEIAAMLNLPLGTIKGRMRLGLDKIRSALAEGLL